MERKNLLLCLLALLLTAACASIGNPDGGRFDETPPRVVGSSPADGAVNVSKRKVQILFDEYIKLEKASEKVVISPPQIEPANVRADGKRVKVDFYDSLRANTTYTIDFSDAIEDNNEGNPMGQYTFSFSTGDVIDTMQVSGRVLNAADLEPIKGIMVGLYPADSTWNDTLFRTRPFLRVSRTNGEGRFTIKGVKDGAYRVRALEDKDGDFVFSQKNERVAFDTTVYVTGSFPDVRMDTVWRDSLWYDSIRVVPYTHYTPDDVLLLAFLEDGQERHLLKTVYPEPTSFTFYFTAPSDSTPRIKGLNFDERCLVADASLKNDTVTFWVTDTALIHRQDTLSMILSYMETDTLGQLVVTNDTLDLSPKTTYAKIAAERSKQIEAWEKDRERRQKKAKKPLPYEENPYERTWLEAGFKPSGSLAPNQNVRYLAKEPILEVDTTKIHFYVKKDTDWLPAPFLFMPEERSAKSYMLYAEWEPGQKYRFVMDTAAVVSVLEHESKSVRQEFHVRAVEEYGSIFIHVISPDTGVVVQLLSKNDKVEAQQRTDKDGNADFFFMKPGEYYMRCYVDANGNGQWDTGDYASGLQPERVYYFGKPLPLKAQWDLRQDWDIRAVDVARQKPMAITKQKPDKEKKLKNRNAERDREMQRGRKQSTRR
ncbi:MAG: Ig-like domain-containing protein [Bacteroidaceae bacterium]|nr:Ig-like domain-containing protein [Prevotellaceae bacterium]MDD7657828.1 Ig-like domain-containing protein [Prevotellaceae bacterium]MDY5598439.1 Ig-like domain-containing protein [Bacteroidaceae bacterium]